MDMNEEECAEGRKMSQLQMSIPMDMNGRECVEGRMMVTVVGAKGMSVC
jgi:hypothetical protein